MESSQENSRLVALKIVKLVKMVLEQLEMIFQRVFTLLLELLLHSQLNGLIIMQQPISDSVLVDGITLELWLMVPLSLEIITMMVIQKKVPSQ